MYDPPPQNERKDSMSKKELTREERIRKEFLRLKRSFKDLDKVKMNIVDGLLNRAAFMRIALEDYEKDINENGSIEMFSQSDDQIPYERARPVMQFYNTTNQNYQRIIKQLVDLLPNNQKEKTLEDIVSGLQKPN